MDALQLSLLAIAVIAGSGLLSLLLGGSPRASSTVAVVGAVMGGAIGLAGSVQVLQSGVALAYSAPWNVPGGAIALGVDPLSAFFLALHFVVGALCAVYGRGYLGPRTMPAAAFNGLLVSVALVIVARHAMVFIVAWEVMTLLAYLLITLDHEDASVRRAGWVFLIASHVSVTALIGLFLVLGARAGSLDFAVIAEAWRVTRDGTVWVLILALIGFGIKAGIVGLHGWLPEAHAAAPSHVSAFMSSVLVSLGLYGILRTAMLTAPGIWFGVALMVAGAVGALFGIVLAIGQRDIKRVLAYSTVENIGIILLGLGLGFWIRSQQEPTLAAVAFAGALLHCWNHGAMKSLLFLGAGSVLHATGTKDMERLGGLMGPMRWTGRAMVLGAVAISGLPPLNGFTGEWLLYRGLTQVGLAASQPAAIAAIGGVVALALVGGLAALCFARLIGVVLLGTARSDGAAHAHESPPSMLIPIGLLAVLCVASALSAPTLVAMQTALIGELGGSTALDVTAAASFGSPLLMVNAVLLAAIALVVALVARSVARPRTESTWGCGYAAPTPRMQYTGRAFGELLTSQLLPRWLVSRLRIMPPTATFPSLAELSSDDTDPLTRTIFEPLLIGVGSRFARLRFLQQGNLHIYLLYILAAVMGGLAWVALREGLLS